MHHPYFIFTNGGAAPPPAPVVVPRVIPSGGYPWLGPYRREHPWLAKLPQQVSEIIQVVAEEQLEDLGLPRRLQALRLKRELKAKDLEYHTRYFEALSLERELLIDLEIAQRLKKKIEDEEVIFLIVLASSLG